MSACDASLDSRGKAGLLLPKCDNCGAVSWCWYVAELTPWVKSGYMLWETTWWLLCGYCWSGWYTLCWIISLCTGNIKQSNMKWTQCSDVVKVVHRLITKDILPPGMHNYNPKRHNLIEGVNKCMISRPEAQAKFREYQETLGSHGEVFTDGSKMNERVGAAAVINRHFQRHMGPVHRNVIVYSDSMSCLQAIEGEDTENPFICHIMNLLWLLNVKGTHIHFCWIPSRCGIDGNERVDQLAKETLDHDIDPLVGVHYADLKPLVNSYIQQLVQINRDVTVHDRDLYFVKQTLGLSKKFQHLIRAEEVVITDFELAIQRPPNPISCPEDCPLLVTIVVKHWLLTICSWSVQC